MDETADRGETQARGSSSCGSTGAASQGDPSSIGRYRVIGRLGQGGFGRVYLAHDDDLDRSVAIKVPHPERVAGPEDIEAYLAEARTLARLDHPNIVPVYDVGRTDDGLCYVVSRYIEGSDLAVKLSKARPAFHESVGLVAVVAEALHSAHTRGFVHRDIKPANILIDATGKPWVADFGLALKEEEFGTGARHAGTPAYMSPEQARGEGHRVDGRSDIFSLGVVFYELLTGRMPFRGDSPRELLDQIASTEARPPRQVDDSIPKELERICLKALSKRATERYPTARDMADDLRHWLRPSSTDGNPAAAAPGAARLAEPELPARPELGKAAFLSYASQDKEAAFRFCGLLEGQGIGCWIAPRDVPPGADYGAAIIGAIEATRAMLLFLSAHANGSIHVTHEVERATSKGKRVIPICLEDVPPGPSLELHLATPHRVKAWGRPPVEVAAELARVLSPAPISASSDQRPLKIVPKGLRSFDARDADFFLELLPGPRDRDGLPDSIRFWKVRIEERDAEGTFPVGLIYGPSGCGKSSLVKAGLLPRLGAGVRSVYVEATPDETETRLLKGLRKACPDVPPNQGLVESLTELRRGHATPSGAKVLIVLDQFEQWLHARQGMEGSELVAALRQCDGAHVQAIVMVRDDFWMAATRFMRELEIDLVPDQNIAAVDLFDLRHARKVLMAFGRAYGALPEKTADQTRDQQAFQDQAISGLAQDGKVISVRLALFAEMIKGKPWSPATLREVGGTEGVGVTFLEETFASSQANPKHRLHQKAAQAVLKALLPETGTDIKGQMRSEAELRDASGYASRPRDFDDLIRVLDPELRLITPTDPEGSTGEGQPTRPAGERYYQLTHDYLVHSLRDWLTRKQRQTRRGRAELKLAERAALWNARPEDRHLPSLPEWATIRLLTRKKDWSEPQRKMMRRAGRVHGFKTLGVLVVAAGLVGAGLDIRRRVVEDQQKTTAAGLVQQLLRAATSGVPEIITAMEDYRHWVDPDLKRRLPQLPEDSPQRLHASLALLPDKGQVKFLTRRLLGAGPAELPVIWELLRDQHRALVPRLWAVLEDPNADPDRRFRAACALALCDTGGDTRRWDAVSRLVTERLLATVLKNPSHYDPLIKSLHPVHPRLIAPLTQIFRDPGKPESERLWATSILADYASDQPGVLADLLMDAAPEPFAVLFPRVQAQASGAVAVLKAELGKTSDAAPDRERLFQRQAREAVALVRLGQAEDVWPLLRHSPDPSLRSYIVNWLKLLGADPKALIVKLESLAHDPPPPPVGGRSRMEAVLFDPVASLRRALIVALGEYQDLPAAARGPLVVTLLEAYRNDPDAGIHGAAEWTLRRWKQDEELKKADAGLPKLEDRGDRRWYVNSAGQTLAVIEGPVAFAMGSPATEPELFPDEMLHPQRINRRFAVATKEVTREQYERFVGADTKNQGHGIRGAEAYSPDPQGPQVGVSWYDAAAYCNWLSEQEHLETCYEPNEKEEYAEGMKIAPDFRKRSGYRLPTEAEWEYICRAGAVTSRYYGGSLDLLPRYAWYQGNSPKTQASPCGRLKPNELGLFDLLGNVYEWCQDQSRTYSEDEGKEGDENIIISSYIIYKNSRLLRGGSFLYSAADVRSANRYWLAPSDRNISNGFRPARTYP